MKKRNILLMICICLFALTGCGNTQMDEKKSTVLFKATVYRREKYTVLH